MDPPYEPCPECGAEAGQDCALDCITNAPDDIELAQDWKDVGAL